MFNQAFMQTFAYRDGNDPLHVEYVPEIGLVSVRLGPQMSVRGHGSARGLYLAPNEAAALADLLTDDQRLARIPCLDMVIVRMGCGDLLVPVAGVPGFAESLTAALDGYAASLSAVAS